MYNALLPNCQLREWYVRLPAAALALVFFFTPPISFAIDTIINMITLLVPANTGNLSFMSPAYGQPAALTKSQSDALNTYNNAVTNFRSILSERRAQIDSNQRLPNLPGQALYLARINMMSAYKDLTDALPSKIGRPNKFGIPPAYFDADNDSLQGRCRVGNRYCAGQGPRCSKC